MIGLVFVLGIVVGVVVGLVLESLRPRPRGVSVFWSVQGGSLMAELRAGESKTFGVKIVDAQGNPARVQNPRWSADPPDIVTITASNPAVEPPAPPGPNPAMRPGQGGAGTRQPVTGPRDDRPPAGKSYYATVKASGATGGGSLTFTADADLGDGEKELVGNLGLIVLAGEAVGIEIEEIAAPPE